MFPPSFRELPPPPLELFDLDEAFSSVFSKLAQYTNRFMNRVGFNGKITEQDLESYVKESARITKIEMMGDKEALEILGEMGRQISDFKSIDTIK